jgi:TonB-linked SusC/RagA family outer membrane protein
MRRVRHVCALLVTALAFLSTLTLAAFGDLAAQQVPGSIGGTVVDASNLRPLGGAEVTIVGVNQTVLTNAQGRFILTGIEAPAGQEVSIRVQLIGYASQTVQVPVGSLEVNIQLQPSPIQLEGMVVSALGIEREARALGYSVASAGAEELTENRTPRLMDALNGKLSGVSITPMATGPQGSTKVRIRGQSSLGNNNSPLIVVNGIPIDNTTFGVSGDFFERGGNRNSDTGDGLSSINPDDIVELSVLKGAAASALYGARAKDGVIMITTRNRAQGEGLQFELDTNFMHETPLDYRDYQMEYGGGIAGCRSLVEARPEGTAESGGRPCQSGPNGWGVWSFGEKIEPGMTFFPFPGRPDVEVPYAAQPNQMNDFFRNGYALTNTLTISQGSEHGGFSASIARLNSDGIFPGNTYERYTANLGFTQEIADRLTISGNVQYSNEDRRNPPNTSEQDYATPVIIYTLANTLPLSALEEYKYDETGQREQFWTYFRNRTNPYFALTRFENNIRDRVFGNITARYEVLPWLSAQGRIGQDYWSRDQDYNRPSGSQVEGPPTQGFVNGNYVIDVSWFREINADYLLRGNGSFGDFGVDATLGGNYMRRKLERENTLADEFYAYGLYSLSNSPDLSPQYSVSERGVNSLYGSAELSFRDMLFLTGTLRNDWFSTLSPENWSILYPSVSTSFVFSDALPVPSWLDFGKIRAAYAEVGSDTDVSPYSNILFYGVNQNRFNGYALGGITGAVPNAELKPMRLKEWEVGTELSFVDRVRLDLGYYHRVAESQILSQDISSASGWGSRQVNVGETMNQGIEALLDASLVRRPGFSWNTIFNVNWNKSEALELGVGTDRIRSGFADFHGTLNQIEGEEMNQVCGPGWLRDAQGRIVHNVDGRPLADPVEKCYGSALPKWIGGITNTFNIRGVSISALVDFKLGHKLISGTHTNAVRHGLDPITLQGRDQGCIVGDGVNEDGQPNTACYPIQSYWEAIRTYRLAEQSVFDAGYWQLRQITLGYDLTPHLNGAFGFDQVRLNLSANNVWLIKKWVPHVHPEQNAIFGDSRMGLESTGMPVTRGLGVNVNIRW